MEGPGMEPPSLPSPPSPGPEPRMRRSTRPRQFPRIWRDFEATSYSPISAIPLANEEMFERQLQPPPAGPEALTAPDLTGQSSHPLVFNKYGICRIFTSSSTSTPTPATLKDGQGQTLPPHPFKNDSIFEAVKACCLGPSSKTATGMNELVRVLTSEKVNRTEVAGFSATAELRRLDEFAAKSPIGGGPWQVGSIKIKMPCLRANQPSFSTEKDAPDFEVHGVRYRSLVDLLVSKIQDPSNSGSFVRVPFTEWWCPPGSASPIRIYGEAYSSDVAVQLSEGIKGIPPPVDHPDIESVIVMLMLGSDSTHLTSFGTASLWPIYVFFGNMSKYDSSRPSEFPASHLAYLPKVVLTRNSLGALFDLTQASAAAR